MANNELKIPVIRVKQKIGDFFISAMRAKDLVDISFSDVRRLASEKRDIEEYLGIQRPVLTRRIKEIKEYISGPDATFPTSVILAIDEKCAEYDEEKNELTLKAYTDDLDYENSINYNKIARVIDGQHRIAAFMDENNNYEFSFDEDYDEFDINVSIFIGADIAEQANIFATVNLAQTKVNKSLVYDLTELAKSRSPQKTAHNIAVMLDRENTSPLYQRIKRLGVATPGRKHEPLTQAAFVESIIPFISSNPTDDRNRLIQGKHLPALMPDDLIKTPLRELFIREKDLEIAEIIFNYFSAIEKKWPNSWNEISKSGNLLPKSNAFKALMRFLKDYIYKDIENKSKVPSVEFFYSYFEKIKVSDEDFTTRNFAPGSGGQSTFLKLLKGEISINEIIE